MVILTELSVFAVIFAAYMSARAENPELFRSGQVRLSHEWGLINTLLLLKSSMCVARAVEAARRERNKPARSFLTTAFACGVAFLVIKCTEYGELLHAGVTPATNDFFLYYYVLTLVHLFHLLTGMGILLFLRSLAGKKERTSRQFSYLEGGACYWHMVDVLWISLVPLLYLMR